MLSRFTFSITRHKHKHKHKKKEKFPFSYDYACVYAYAYVTSVNEPLATPGCNYSNVLCWNGKVEFKVRVGSFRLNTVCSLTKGAFKLNWDLKPSKLGLGSKLHSSQRLNFGDRMQMCVFCKLLNKKMMLGTYSSCQDPLEDEAKPAH